MSDRVQRRSGNSNNANILIQGKMAEWSIAAVLKTVDLKGFGGSNPSLSAKKRLSSGGLFFASAYALEYVSKFVNGGL